MGDKTTAIVVGAGPEAGLGGALSTRLAREGLHVFVAGRTPQNVEEVAHTIHNAGGRATAVPTDTTHEKEVAALFDRAATAKRWRSRSRHLQRRQRCNGPAA